MKDLISRSALLNEGIRGKYLVGADGSIFIPVHCVRKYIKEAPAVDAVIPVRCPQCKHFKPNPENDTYCSSVNGLTDPQEDDFCSYGERRADDGRNK